MNYIIVSCVLITVTRRTSRSLNQIMAFSQQTLHRRTSFSRLCGKRFCSSIKYPTKTDCSLSPFHNLRTSTLKHFAIGIIWLRMSYCIRCTSPHIRCMHFGGHIKSPQYSGHGHYSDATKCNPNYCNAMQKHQY